MTPGGKRSATNPRRNSKVRNHSRALSEHFITAGARAGPLLTSMFIAEHRAVRRIGARKVPHDLPAWYFTVVKFAESLRPSL